ncbi:hypothetical protein HO173_005551 [Letharia columbiana]|uniref:Lysine-specific metallo-endopeptidase domain-containing protein n=1 Tax=Letharia columbiana TaxID=112416 RepID=A0A8H6FWW9_9LECA|nr:uncharacterized protein HO173_005551 [Letharia columbiana]KAF6236298.1 hypothetical protein HO173_005551 [Letharia columbiana]
MQNLFIERYWLFLSLLSLACARPQYIAPLKGVQTGPYHIYNCGTRTPSVSVLINTLIDTLQPVLDDVSRPFSSPAYTTFFKNIAFAPIVYDLLSNITTGAPTSPGPHALKDAPPELFGAPITPQFVCVTAYEQLTWSLEPGGQGGRQLDAYTACHQSPVHAFAIVGTRFLKNYIVLCPAFWTYAAIPSSSKSTCLPVDPHFNRFREGGGRLVQFQLWVILHELAHAYIYARSGLVTDVSTANNCMWLAASSAVNNAQNFVFYAANIRLGCTDFPRVARPSFGSVELMEIDANTTLSGGSESQNVSMYGGQSIGNNLTRTNMDLPNIVT